MDVATPLTDEEIVKVLELARKLHELQARLDETDAENLNNISTDKWTRPQSYHFWHFVAPINNEINEVHRELTALAIGMALRIEDLVAALRPIAEYWKAMQGINHRPHADSDPNMKVFGVGPDAVVTVGDLNRIEALVTDGDRSQ